MLHKLFIISFLMTSVIGSAQTIASFEVKLTQATNGLEIPASINLDEITYIADSSLSLVEIQGNKKIPVPFQVVQGEQRTLHWLIETKNNTASKRKYELVKAVPGKFSEIVADAYDGMLTFQSGKTNLLRYYFKTIYPPAGLDTAFRRSGFIHPLWTPHGQELTRIQPPDHHHHYGLWNPWTHVLFERDTIDFWNIGDKKGTVRFARFIAETNGSIYSEFKALHEHVVLKKGGGEKVALNELQTVRVYKPEDNSDYYIVDITSELNCATQSPFHILAYRYAGLGWRATEFWDKNNSEMLTSEGKTRDNTDGSKARWCIVQGALPGNDYGGAVMLSYPANYNHPEPLRIWDKNANNGRGDVFANFAPTKDKDWILEPGKTYVLKYRLVVFNGKFNAAKAESAWQYFAAPPEVKVIKK
ncbi:MAG: PmoA family protein [Bacteroidota bacterium]|nr:PmoA family protein [Bacteroidota bacterium]